MSTADQSCARQERDLAAFAARADYEVVGTYKETASGVKVDRAERRKVLALAQRREIDAVLVTELSRWGRSTTDLLATLKELEARRVSLVALNGMAFDLTTPHGRMMATLLAGIAEFERELTQERIRSGIAAAKARGKRLGRQPGQRPKSDRLAPKVLALIAKGRSYRLVGREVGLSKNTVADIVKRSRPIPLAIMLLCFAGVPAWAQSASDTVAARSSIDAAPRTIRTCKVIAALADRGAPALRAADLIGRDAPIDLRNNGHPERIVRTEQGTAHIPYLTDEVGNPVTYDRDDYIEEKNGLAPEIAVVRVHGRVWEVAWAAEELDGRAMLSAATDGTAVCRFHVALRPPVFRMLPGGEQAKADTYRGFLLGHGAAPPSAGLDPKAVDAASGLNRPDTGATYVVEPFSWRADLLNDGQLMTLIRVWFLSSAGAGCERNMLGLVQDGRVTKLGLLPLYGSGGGSDGDMVPLSRALKRLVHLLSCVGLAETPVLGRDGRAYVLLSNKGQVRLLAGVRDGTMQPLARLLWQARNEISLPFRP